MQKTRVLVSGSGGFIGSHLVSSLKELDVFTLPHRVLTSPLELTKIVKDFNPEMIYHLAAFGQMSNQKDDQEIFNANLVGTFNLLQATKDIPYKALVYFSTSSVLLPYQTMYSATKLGGEALCKAFMDEYKKPIVVVRPFSIYGDGEAEFRFIPTVIKSLLYDEHMELASQARHDWVHVDDFIDTLLNVKVPGFINLGTGYSYSNLEIVRKLEFLSGKKLNYTEKKLRSFDTKDWVCPTNSVVSNINEGLLKTFNYYVKLFTSN
jgi:nucleoside-diphosphate-sugar epimerase